MANIDGIIAKLEFVNKLCDDILEKQEKILANQKALQSRATELRNEAEAGEHTCPSCSGVGHFLVGNFDERCPECEGTGQA